MHFYVYAYLDPRKPGVYKYLDYTFDYEPFYIGKGQRERMWVHIRIAKQESTERSEKNNKILKLLSLDMKPVIIKLKDELSNDEAFSIEKDLISAIGRTCVKTGPLTNIYPGGEGAGDMPESTKKKISNSKKGKKLSPEAKEAVRRGVIGRKHSEESKRKMAEASIGRKHSE